MTDAIEVFETGLFSALNVDALNNRINGGIHDGIAPTDTDMPFVVYQFVVGGDDNDNPNRDRDVLYDIRVTGEDKDKVLAAVGEIDTLLHEQTLTVAGYTNYDSRRVGDIKLIEQQDGKRIYTIGGQYRFRLT